MKVVLSIILLFFISVLTAQSSVTIQYKVKLYNDSDKNININKWVKQAVSGAEKIKFILKANQSESIFYLEDNIYNKEKKVKIALDFSEYIAPIYNSFNEEFYYFNTIDENYFKKNEYLVKVKKLETWKIKEESKKINGFLCYKAEGMLLSEEEQVKPKKVIAWYCPEINCSTGPNGFGGLPGLILEIQVGNVLFGAERIESFKKSVTIDRLDKGKLIDFKKFIAISEDRILKAIKNRE